MVHIGKKELTLKKRKHSDNPVYLSHRMQEYQIVQDKQGLHYIKLYGGGKPPKSLQGKYTNYSLAEKSLINYLVKIDRVGQSRYPGCPERKPTNYTRTFLKD